MEAIKMKGKLAHIVLGTTILFVYFLLAANLYVYASDAPSIAFSSNRDGDYDIYIMDIKGKNLHNLSLIHISEPTRPY